MMPWLNRLITRGSPFGFTACIGSKSPPAVMICCTFTASIAAHPPMAAADSSINARTTSGPDSAGEEQADKSIRRTKAITNINPSLNSKRARTVSSSYRNALYPGLVKPTIHLCAFSLCLVFLCLRRDRGYTSTEAPESVTLESDRFDRLISIVFATEERASPENNDLKQRQTDHYDLI